MTETTAQPAVFVSHGSPMIVVEESPAARFLKGLGDEIPRPSAILVATAHWETAEPTVGGNAAPETIHDFRGFPKALYDMRYPAPGAPEVAERARALLTEGGFAAGVDAGRGLDHGVWTPLMLAWPDAGIPVVPLSVQPHRGGAWHYRVGRALAPLTEEGVLILGSGAATHDLSRWRGQPLDADPQEDVQAFHDWLMVETQADDRLSLLGWQQEAPFGAENHPTPEHFMPFFVALGAAHGRGPARVLHHSIAHGVISMAAFAWG
ncbi:DODA-type extradiol aromatic ring-opening family dioxygenase [Futiania mangrovi]|uniref:Dioxygenase n=1 Tax=Futiania mangrovi TaxID=2959716 RepID=A0A9J6PBU5_9PROT|nr:class III extradiol ring-cleavage dioxygenase [Futiania mangrovii]MCP1337636.1 dioxygenase [Futiania mangrovii]